MMNFLLTFLCGFLLVQLALCETSKNELISPPVSQREIYCHGILNGQIQLKLEKNSTLENQIKAHIDVSTCAYVKSKNMYKQVLIDLKAIQPKSKILEEKISNLTQLLENMHVYETEVYKLESDALKMLAGFQIGAQLQYMTHGLVEAPTTEDRLIQMLVKKYRSSESMQMQPSPAGALFQWLTNAKWFYHQIKSTEEVEKTSNALNKLYYEKYYKGSDLKHNVETFDVTDDEIKLSLVDMWSVQKLFL